MEREHSYLLLWGLKEKWHTKIHRDVAIKLHPQLTLAVSEYDITNTLNVMGVWVWVCVRGIVAVV